MYIYIYIYTHIHIHITIHTHTYTYVLQRRGRLHARSVHTGSEFTVGSHIFHSHNFNMRVSNPISKYVQSCVEP